MEGTLALWCELVDGCEAKPHLQLHVNLWRDLSEEFNFLDVGFRLSDVKSLQRFHLFFPVPIKRAAVLDLANTLKYGGTLKAVFNDLVTVTGGRDLWYETELDGAPYLTVHLLESDVDLSFESIAMPSKPEGTIITFGDRLCDRIRAASGAAHYLRLRVRLEGASKGLFTSDVAAGDAFFLTATNVTEVTEFRFNERRSYPDEVARRARSGGFAIDRVHYFLIRDVEYQLGSHHSALRNIRRLEGTLWTPYLRGGEARAGFWQVPAHVVRRLAIYHWSASATKDKPLADFTAFASFRLSRVHLWFYAIAIILLGALGSLLASWTSARMEQPINSVRNHADGWAAVCVVAAICACWLITTLVHSTGTNFLTDVRHALRRLIAYFGSA